MTEARRALAVAPREPWAYALLGQCLLRSDPHNPRVLSEAAQALGRARALAPTNGYFVRLSLEVADAQYDQSAADHLLARAWWAGAPVERWLPDGPPQPQGVAAESLKAADRPALPAERSPSSAAPVTRLAVTV